MIFRVCCIIVFLFSSTICYSQDNKPVISPSPTAAGLGKYGDVPVSNYTGIPQINIPLYTISENDLNLPLSLNYHASGIRVEEDASWCGLGFSVFAGGVITRSIRGIDDLPNDGNSIGYPQYIFPVSADANNNYIQPSNPWGDMQYFREVNGRLKDSEPDVFYFNFAGYSGKFFIKQRPTASSPYVFIIESQAKLKISLEEIPNGWSWKIQTADGTKYYFSTKEQTKTYSGSTTVLEPSPDNYPADGAPKTNTSSWYLDRIVTQGGKLIDFTYTAPSVNGTRKTINKSEDRTYILGTNIIAQTPGCTPDNIPPHHAYMSSLSVVYDVYLKEINFPNGRVEFITSDRLDMQPAIANGALAKKLDKIIISSVDSFGSLKELKSYEFNYSYFTNFDPYLSYGIGSYVYNYTKTYSGKRLKLLSVTEKNGGLTKPPHQFEYHTNSYSYGDIPDKYSKSRDHWGFFNNSFNTTVPDEFTTYGYVSTMIPPYLDVARQKFYNGSDREQNEDYINLGMLREIKYPTGGSTRFEYEGNDYSNFPNQFKKQKTTQGLIAVGSLVSPEEVWIEPDMVSVAPITITEPTVIDVTVYSEYSWNYCGSTSPGYGGTGSFSVRNTGSTPTFYRGIVPEPNCNGSAGTRKFFVLPPGTYELRVLAEQYVYTMATVTWNQTTSEPLLAKKGGGLRILRTVDYDGVSHDNDLIRKYMYTLDDGVKSSGKLMAPLNYEYEHTINASKDCSGLGFGGATYQTQYLNRSSSSNISMGSSAQGNTIGYSLVTVLNGESGENGKTVYAYKNNTEVLSSSFFPNIPNQPRPENGLLEMQTDYKRKTGLGNAYQKVREIKKTYTSEPASRESVKGFKMMGGDAIEAAQQLGFRYIPIIKFYDSISEWWHPVSDSTFVYDQNDDTKFSVTGTNYFYENANHYQLTKMIESRSDGSNLITKYTYPSDYSTIASGSIAAMKSDNKYMHSYVVEKVSQVQRGADIKTVGAQFTSYKDEDGFEANNNSNILPAKVSILDITKPKDNFTSSLTSGLAADVSYIDKKFLRYETGTSNLVEVKEKGGPALSYLWGYNRKYVIAEVQNASKNQIIYENFEEHQENDELRNTTNIVFMNNSDNLYSSDSKTGKRSFKFGPSNLGESLLPLPSGRYVYSYWSKGGIVSNEEFTNGNSTVPDKEGWVYNQGEFWVPTSAYFYLYPNESEITILIDDFRIYPKSAQITTFTYNEFGDLTSKADQRGNITYFDYDGFQRLKYVKDQNRNILKSYDYHYKP